MSTKRSIKSAYKTPLCKDANGNVLCRWCKTVVMPPRKTFCSAECVHEWKLRSSGSYLRKCLFKRDKGICAICKLNTSKITRGFRRPLTSETKKQWQIRVAAVRKKYDIPKYRKTAWDADHILPVWQGGGLTGLSGFRTLCIKCHKARSSQDTTFRATIKKHNA